MMLWVMTLSINARYFFLASYCEVTWINSLCLSVVLLSVKESVCRIRIASQNRSSDYFASVNLKFLTASIFGFT